MPATISPTRWRSVWPGRASTCKAKPANETKTFGYHRAGVLSAFVNALTLVVLSVWILYEAVLRLRHPEVVHETIMLVVAGLGPGAQRRHHAGA